MQNHVTVYLCDTHSSFRIKSIRNIRIQTNSHNHRYTLTFSIPSFLMRSRFREIARRTKVNTFYINQLTCIHSQHVKRKTNMETSWIFKRGWDTGINFAFVGYYITLNTSICMKSWAYMVIKYMHVNMWYLVRQHHLSYIFAKEM